MDSGFKKSKIIRRLLSVLAVVFVSCSSNEPEAFDGILDNGVYSYYGTEYIVTIGTDYKDGWNYETNCEPGYISIVDAKTGTAIYVQRNGISNIVSECNINGVAKSYDGWGYDNGLTILCAPSSRTTFVGFAIKQSPGIELPGEMKFVKLK